MSRQPPANVDANAGALPLDAAWQAYAAASRAMGNPSSAHSAGSEARALLKAARAQVAAALGAEPDEIVFTSGGTEANALAIAGTLALAPDAHVVCSGVEHASVAQHLSELADTGRIRLTRVAPGRDGRLDAAAMGAALQPDTALVCLVAACNETGVVQPVAEVAELAAAHHIPVHTDAVQALDKLPLDVSRLHVSTLAVSGHKVGAVGGVGALFVRRGHRLRPQLDGGGQEHGLRASTENVAGAASLAAALAAKPWSARREVLEALRDRLEADLQDRLEAVEIIGAGRERLCNTSCIRLAGCEGDGVMMALDVAGFAVSTGSACSTGSVEPSPILLAMGLSAAEARECVRFSWPFDATAQDVERLVPAVVDVVRRMRGATSSGSP